jgi:hypothetical protein
MKFNIKNIPSEPDYANLGEVEALRSYNYRAEKWCEGFEKELRERLLATWKPCNVKDFIKEILGDET